MTEPATARELSSASAMRWVLLGLTAAAIYLCWPLWPALVLAAWTAALARPLLMRFEKRLKGRRRAAAALSLLLCLALLIPLGLVVVAVISGVQELWEAISASPSAKSALEAIASGSANAPTPQLPTSFSGAVELLERYGSQGVSILTNLAGAAARGAVGLFIYLGGSFVFLLEGPAIWAWLERHSPLDPRQLERLSEAFHETGRGLLVGFGLTSVTQGLVATIVYASLGVPRWWVLGPITGLASIIPLIGTSLVWAPIALGLFFTGHIIKGAILVALGLGVIGTVDNLLRPVFARMGSLKLSMFLLFVSAMGGLAAIGAWGALLGPLVVRLWMEAVVVHGEADTGAASTHLGPREHQPMGSAPTAPALTRTAAPPGG